MKIHLTTLASLITIFNLHLVTLPLLATPSASIEEMQVDSTAKQAHAIFNITSYGITPNSNQDATPALLKAAEAAVAYVKANHKRAEIFIPTGKYQISQLELQGLDTITLHLGHNAQLFAYPKSSSIDPSKPYIIFDSCTSFVIRGAKGSFLDGNGASWWSEPNQQRPHFISFQNCQNYSAQGFIIQNAPFHTVVLSDCTQGKIHDITILAPPDSPNTDGIDPLSNVDDLEIYNCAISNGDDGFAINSIDGPMNNIYIHDCTLNNGHGMSIGSSVHHDITNLRVENLTIEGAWYAIRLKFKYTTDKAHLQNISYTNINAKNLTRGAIAIIPDYSGKTDMAFTLDNISINNVTCVNAPQGLSLALGSAKQAITPIVLNHVSITGTTKPDHIANCPIQVIN